MHHVTGTFQPFPESSSLLNDRNPKTASDGTRIHAEQAIAQTLMCWRCLDVLWPPASAQLRLHQSRCESGAVVTSIM